jgi:DNA-binding winged helix-turn-helix (wHTH) protein/TolB-like protein
MECGAYRFGLFEFDVENLELRRQGSLIRLQSQPARVLACLIQNADRVVVREELREAIWGSETFVDFERGLNFCIAQIRSALNDDSARPVYIRTLPKRGYQFIAPVVPISGDSKPQQAQQEGAVTSPPQLGKRRAVLVGVAVFVVGVASLVTARWLRGNSFLNQPTVIAVVRFDNETGSPGLLRFSDALTDNVVERLTAVSNGRYAVIGNSRILRLPREQRDLNAIASSLHAKYVVLGQVQSQGDRTRILAHLIHMPEQTHVWVVRVERTLTDPLSIESEVAQQIADQFSVRAATGETRSFSPASANH